MLPRRLGVRFALEAGFLVLLALGAGLANLRPLYIVIIMAAAWVLVALAELTSERIDRSPFSYLSPRSAWDEDEGPKRIFGPPVEERTVVAPPETKADPAQEEPEPDEPQPEESEPQGPVLDKTQPEEPEPEALAILEPAPESAAEPEVEAPKTGSEQEGEPEPSLGRRVRSLLRRREPEPEAPEPATPRHVKLLPRRAAPESSRASQEVAELFGSPAGDKDEPEKPKETGT
ncbi:MAG: hypothetical protein E6F97_02450 [Actinobacteria bacterium]|nr:MAG: hypothetical protein E6F97_02450 [Actinomycetota bacterium]